jgi:fibronectin type 3 domain-containing protein
MKYTLLILSLLLLVTPLWAADVRVTAAGNTVTLAWDPNTETDLTGYNIYHGSKAGGPYTKVGSVGVMTAPTFVVTEPLNGTYYYVVTAFNTGGAESGYSNEVSKFINVPPANPRNLRIPTPTEIENEPLANLLWRPF